MTDSRTPQQRHKIMQSVKSKDTTPELAVRKLLTKMGYRYRLHYKRLPGTPDIVLVGRKKAIFVHGCFWHAHGCRIGQPPKSRLDYWQPKLAQNVRRDRSKIDQVKELGWDYLVIWQCELGDGEHLAKNLANFLGEKRDSDRHDSLTVLG
jgi:DNA mismatch endonuclease (patch repair protein)